MNVTFDPDDPAVVERVARVLARQTSSTIQIPDVAAYVEQHWRHHVNRSRAVLAALAAPGGEPDARFAHADVRYVRDQGVGLRALRDRVAALDDKGTYDECAAAWSDYRRDHGVSQYKQTRMREHKAFCAGWLAAYYTAHEAPDPESGASPVPEAR